MSRPFIRGQVAIDSMRDNGFLSAAHALAELIDNSVQAKADRVELITFEHSTQTSNGRTVKQIDKIGILDNGRGMPPETLHLALEFGASENRKDNDGIGKFGMGLPNSSISQCKHVDVWSWTSRKEIYYTFLDIDEIKEGRLETIPNPKEAAIPKDILNVIGEPFPESGTLVLWSKIDRCQWKTGKSIYKHTQNIVGRMYRMFLNKGKVSITFKNTVLKNSLYLVTDEQRFQPNDPIYLLKNTSLPDLPHEFSGESMFELCNDCQHEIEIADENGKPQKLTITGTVLKKSVLGAIRATTTQSIGNTAWGKHASNNIGLSVMRSGREIALMPEFINTEAKSKGWARWYGIQIDFAPSLDNIFGVTNNKQHVVNLQKINPSADASLEGFDSEREYRSELLANNDPKLRIYEVVQQIKDVEDKLIARMRTYNFSGTGQSFTVPVENIPGTPSAVEKVNKKSELREEVHPTEQPTITEEELKVVLKEIGADQPNEKAKTILDRKLQVWVEQVPMATTAFFDVSTKKGFTLLQINSNHVFTTRILQNIPDDAREALEVCLGGWARMERECSSEKRLLQLQMARKDWGQLLEDYLEVDDEA